MVGPAAAVGGQDRDGVSNRRSALYTLCLFEAFTHREACHWIRGSLLSPMNPVPLPPQGETRDLRRKNSESYTSRTISAFSPFGGWRHHLSPASGGTIKLRKAIFFIKWLYAKHGLFCSRLRGKSRAVGKGEANAASQSAEWLFCHMILKVNPVTLTLYSSPAGRYHHPLNLLNPGRRAAPLSHHHPRAKGPSNLRTLRTFGA